MYGLKWSKKGKMPFFREKIYFSGSGKRGEVYFCVKKKFFSDILFSGPSKKYFFYYKGEGEGYKEFNPCAFFLHMHIEKSTL